MIDESSPEFRLELMRNLIAKAEKRVEKGFPHQSPSAPEGLTPGEWMTLQRTMISLVWDAIDSKESK